MSLKSRKSGELSLVGEFAAGISHELRNPLSAVRNAFHYIRRRMESRGFLENERKVEMFLEIIEKELTIANGIIQDLLDYARDRPLRVSAFDVPTLIHSALQSLEIPQSVRVELDFPASLQPVEVDREHMLRVLVNLLENAVEALGAGEGGTITVRAEPLHGVTTIRIEDTGPGMPDEVVERAFEPLYTTKQRGSGLGLAVAHRLVSRHGGQLEVESEIGKGTTVTITLPTTASLPPAA